MKAPQKFTAHELTESMLRQLSQYAHGRRPFPTGMVAIGLENRGLCTEGEFGLVFKIDRLEAQEIVDQARKEGW